MKLLSPRLYPTALAAILALAAFDAVPTLAQDAGVRRLPTWEGPAPYDEEEDEAEPVSRPNAAAPSLVKAGEALAKATWAEKVAYFRKNGVKFKKDCTDAYRIGVCIFTAQWSGPTITAVLRTPETVQGRTPWQQWCINPTGGRRRMCFDQVNPLGNPVAFVLGDDNIWRAVK